MTTLVSTDFTGTNGAAWPAPWTVGAGTLTIQTGRGQQVTPATQWSDANAVAGQTITDARVTTTMRLTATTGVGQRIQARFDTATGNGYGLYFTPEWGAAQLVRVTGWADTVLLEDYGTAWAAATDYRVVLEVTGAQVRAKWWLATGTEPAAWALEVTDATHTTGDVRLVTVATLAAAATGLWDDVTVDTVTAPVLAPLDPAQAGRVGFHNDAFLASDDDWGTFSTFANGMDVPTLKTWLAGQTGAVPMGGETANVNPPRSDLPSARVDLAAYHWTFLNPDYNPAVLAGWGQDGRDEVARNLGHRLRLVSSSLPVQVTPGATFTGTVTVANDGYSAPYRARPARLVFTDGATTVTRDLPDDVRTWAPGTTTLSVSVAAPPTAGSYTVHLALPDAVRTEPAYAIQFANLGTWDATNGRNTLGSVSVAAATQTGSGAAALTGGGSLAAVGAPAPTGAAALSGAGTLVAGGTPALTRAAALSGAGTLTAAGAVQPAAAATLTGSGSLTATGTAAQGGAGTAALTGGGSLAAAGAPAAVQTAALAGGGTLAAAGAPAIARAATLTGAGTLSATPAAGTGGTAALTGTGALGAAGTPTLTRTAAMTGAGTLTAGGTPKATTTATLTGVGTLGAAGGGSQPGSGSAALTGAGTLAAATIPRLTGTATFTGTGALTAGGAPRPTSTAALTGGGQLAATYTARYTGAAAFAGSGTLAAAATPKTTGVATLVGAGQLTTTPVPGTGDTATLTGGGTLTATGRPGPSGPAAPLRDLDVTITGPRGNLVAVTGPTALAVRTHGPTPRELTITGPWRTNAPSP